MEKLNDLILVANVKSGQGRGSSIFEIAERICAEQKINFVKLPVSDPAGIESVADKAVELALKSGGTLVVGGGDGTIRAVAEKAHGRDVRFAVVPCGTFNFFARAHGIPDDHEQAIRLAIAGDTKPVRLGSVNDRTFLINASLGIYARSIREREKQTKKFGRKRSVVILSTLKTFLSELRPFAVDLITEKVARRVYTPTIFIGNNAIQLRNLNLEVAQCMKKDHLAVVTMKPVGKWDVLRMVARGLTKTLDNEEALETFCVDSLIIQTRVGRETVALDGEIFKLRTPLRIESLPASLNLVKPT